jgi:hypothetical protein
MRYGDKVTIEQVKGLNAAAGKHFFSKDTMRFFRSRTDAVVYSGADGWYFVTSEQFETFEPYRLDARKYTVRVMREDGSIDEPEGHRDGFQKYDNLRKARKVAQQLAADSWKVAGIADIIEILNDDTEHDKEVFEGIKRNLGIRGS